MHLIAMFLGDKLDNVDKKLEAIEANAKIRDELLQKVFNFWLNFKLKLIMFI